MKKRSSETFYDPNYHFDEYGLMRETATSNILVFCRRTGNGLPQATSPYRRPISGVHAMNLPDSRPSLDIITIPGEPEVVDMRGISSAIWQLYSLMNTASLEGPNVKGRYVLPETVVVTRPLIEEDIHCARYGDTEPVHVILPAGIALQAEVIDARTWIDMRNT